jgi:hypothetical protein
MRNLGVIAAVLTGCALALAACGSGGAPRPLSLNELPLVPGASVEVHTRQCDGGSHAFCAIQAVIVDRHAGSSGALVAREQDQLRSQGWTTTAGDDGVEVAADSPGHKFRVTYATALHDLIGVDQKWIKRPWPIWSALSQTMFNRVPAMSILLEVGPT